MSFQTRMVVLSYLASQMGMAKDSAAYVSNGIGSTAQLFSGIVPIWLKNSWGWDAVFVSFIMLAVFSCLAVLPVARQGSLLKA